MTLNNKILITGGAGFIGANLIEKLYSFGYENIVSIDNYSTGLFYNHISDVIYHSEDINNIRDYSRYGKFDIIYHCAAKSRIQKSFNDNENYFLTNIIGTYNVVDFAAKNQIPVIYIGTSSHHGGRFSNPYTFTKDIGEDIIKLYQIHFGLSASIARLYNVYGPKELTDENGTLIGKLKYNYWYNLPFTIYGNGSKRRDFTHVYDIVDGLIKIMIKQKYNHIFELGRGDNLSIKQVIDMFEYDNIIYKEDLSGEMQETLADNILARELLDWKPKLNLEEYIEDIKQNRDFKYNPIIN